MASAYPGALDTFATNKANATATTTDHPAHHNDLADAVNKIEAQLGVNAGTWANYSVTWTADSSAPSLGDGELVGRYSRIGNVVFVRMTFDAGASTTFGSGFWGFSLPVTGVDSSASLGTAYAMDGDGVPMIFGAVRPGSTTALQILDLATSGQWGSLIPFTWAVGYSFTLELVYEAA